MRDKKTFFVLLGCSALTIAAFLFFSSNFTLSARSPLGVTRIRLEDATNTLPTLSFETDKRKTPKHHDGKHATKSGAVVSEDKKSFKPNRTDPEAKPVGLTGLGKKNKTMTEEKKVSDGAVTASRLATTANKNASVKKEKALQKSGKPAGGGKKNNINTHQPPARANFSAVNSYNNSDKWVVFVCDGRRSCGGWGDRQRALTGVYVLALVTGRRFALVLTRPCAVTHHYVPNLVPWDVPLGTLKAAGSNVSLDDVNSRLKMTARMRFMDFNAAYPQRVVYIRTNGEFWLGLRNSKLYEPVLPGWAKGTRAQYFAAAWRRLMKPSPSLQGALDAFLGKIRFEERTQPLVCAHVRVGRSATFKGDSAVRCNITTLPVLWNFLQRWVNNGSRVFLATDSYEVRNLTRQRFGDKMLDTGEQIVHVDQRLGSVPGVCEGFGSALLDQLILSRCDVLVTSHSIFSERAAFLRGRSDDLYNFMKGKIRKISI